MFDHKHVYVSLLNHKCLKVKHVSVSCFYSVPNTLQIYIPCMTRSVQVSRKLALEEIKRLYGNK